MAPDLVKMACVGLSSPSVAASYQTWHEQSGGGIVEMQHKISLTVFGRISWLILVDVA
jgi:hypothetical protein